ncbi:MAG TPA: peptidylprolyl isomerase [Bacteroidales bacterium]|nr:peptidylprolyl isomerase [Bacteroidales bacterium]
MKYSQIRYAIFLILIISSCNTNNQKKEKTDQYGNNRIILINTPYGDMKIELYNETPKHRDNFIKLVKNKYYNGTLFHRVIKNFMIQGGDPDSKNAAPGTQLGNGGPGYTIPAEFNPSLYHKKGALAAAREGDDINPEKASSGSQFYIVQGKKFTNDELDELEESINKKKLQSLYSKILEQQKNKALENDKVPDYSVMVPAAKQKAITEFKSTPKYHFSSEQRKAYKTIGGTPHLDGSYTVFGQVIEGLDVIDKIASVQTDSNDRPLKNIPIEVSIIK